jgi:hypothetical protein
MPPKPGDRVQIALMHGGARVITASVVMATENGRACVLQLETDVIGIMGQVLFSGEAVAVQADNDKWTLATAGGDDAVPIKLTRMER